MRNKLFAITVCLLFAISTMVLPAYAAPSIVLNGQALQSNNPPVMENGNVLVPVRAISEALGAKVDWDNPTKTATVTLGSFSIQLVTGGDITVNGQKLDTAARAKLYNGATMIPLSAVGNLLGASVDWNQDTQTVTISTTRAGMPGDAVEDDDAAIDEEAAGAKAGDDAAAVDEEATETSDDEAVVDEEAAETGDDEAAVDEEAAETGDDEATADGDAAETGAATSQAGAGTPFQLYLEGLKAKFNPEKAKHVSITYQFIINEGNKGEYYITIENGELVTGEGTVQNPTVTITIGEQLWLDIASGKEDGTVAYFTKKFSVDGDPTLIQKMSEFFQ